MAIAVVSGALANRPGNGGGAWVRLNWVLGLKQLGFEVYFIEQIQRDACIDRAGATVAFETCENLRYFQDVTGQFGLAPDATLVYEDGERIHGLEQSRLFELAGDATLLVNLSGHLRWQSLFTHFRRKVYVDLDPGFTQFWYATGNRAAHLEGHDYFLTVGANIGKPECSIPAVTIPWRSIRPPVTLSYWPVDSAKTCERFTTVANWRGPYGPIEHAGAVLGLKVHEFRRFLELPERVPCPFEIALTIHEGDDMDRQRLLGNGWRLVNPATATSSPALFQQYIQESSAEFSAAQGVYVQTQSGWFSDRTACYLASGKPALVQDTGLGRNYPAGWGLVTFSTLEEAVKGAESILGDYAEHCLAARALAESHFDSAKVLGGLLDEIGVCP
jgi:hypothetical protein